MAKAEKSGGNYTTLAAIARKHGVKADTISEWMRLPGSPARGPDGWDALTTDRWAMVRKAEVAGHQSATNADLKRKKLQREIDRIDRDIAARDIDLGVKRKDTVPRAEMDATLSAMCRIVRRVLEHLPRDVSAIVPDPIVKRLVEQRCDELQARIAADFAADPAIG